MVKIKNPSKNHSNKDIVNFLVYKHNDYYLKKFIPFYKGVMVDLGCGEAPYKEYFLKFVDKYIGVDWNSSYHNIKADVISDLNERIDLEDEIVDCAIAISVMEYLYNPEKFLEESYRILKKNGVMIMQVPFQWWVHEVPYDYYRFTPYGLKYLLNKVGFRDVKIFPIGGFFTLIFAPLFLINQLIAPILDILDFKKELEPIGYWVVCKK